MFRAALLICLIWGGVLLASPAQAADLHAVHRVKKGETLYAIAKEYGTTPAALAAANHLPPGASLRVGQKLAVPGKTASRPAPTRAAVPAPSTAATATTPPPPAAEDNGKEDRDDPPPKYLFIVGKLKAAIDDAPVRQGRWRYIVFHHSGTSSGNAKAFDYFHRNVRGMENGLAYHFVIGNGHGSGDGEIEVGGRWTKQLQGGHLHSDELNMIALGVCFVGDFNTTRPTKRQIAAAIELVTYLRQRCGGPDILFKGHKEINPRPTECPGKLFPLAAFHKIFD
ncbi:N-acetylmuramoyl-L-alanine amidase [Verrucomicrobium sp. GAS474]|uniref:N-acetylmuramoyl-L-alanine amidase n=1 Tax=Verrucomicrobium sp. GAS474 TaxID=1882831 RepID=UPI00087980D4|nr:N-acetylmuramoyl-L-alanine amidase [Verrucomicrobium sp. GAS474]SDT99665.1 N-acetylmuramoyl-L-alanine amidase [Verrucomicrobium sp. GAS474]